MKKRKYLIETNHQVYHRKEYITKLEAYQTNLHKHLCPETVKKTKHLMSVIPKWIKNETYDGAKQLLARYEKVLEVHEKGK